MKPFARLTVVYSDLYQTSMDLVKAIILIIYLTASFGVFFHDFDKTGGSANAVALNFEAEDKSENSSEEDELHDVSFENNHSEDSAVWHNHLIVYSSTYTPSIELPPEYP